MLSWILGLGIIVGQLIKLPNSTQGITLIDFAVILLCIFGLIKSRFKLKKAPLLIKAGLVFIVIQIMSLVLTPLKLNPTEYLISFMYTLRFSLYLLLGWIFYADIFPDLKKQLKITLLLSGFFIAILGLFQLIIFPDLSFLKNFGWDPHYFRLVSTFFDPNFSGAFLVLTLLILSQNIKTIFGNKKLSILIFGILFVSLALTFSRSSYGMFLISFLTLSFLIKSKKLALISSVLFVVLIINFFVYTKLVSQPRNIDRVASASFRLDTWQQGIALFEKNPLLGVGFNAYKYGLAQNGLADQDFLNSHGATSNDSSLLFVLATTGIIGLASYLFFILSAFRNYRKNILLTSAVLGLLFHSFFANSLFYPPIFLWVLLISSL